MKINVGRDLYLHGRIGWKGLNISEYLSNGNYRIINATALMDGFVDWNNCGFITKERYEESPEIMLKENDILISKDGTLGKIGYVKNMISECTVAAGIFVLRNTIPDQLDFDYLYHLLKSNVFKNFIRNYKASGSTINHLYQVDLEHFEVDAPSISSQRKIAAVLSALDNKIALNRRITAKLEQMAKRLYDYWFVQFDFPNAEGMPYKSSGGKMVYNATLKREIPEGWEVSSILKKGIYNSDYTANGSFADLAANVSYNEGEPYALLVRIVDFNDDFNNKEKQVFINKHSYDYLKTCSLKGGEIIICNVGNAGATYRCPFLKMPMSLGPNGIVVNGEKYNNFLYMYFRSSIGSQQIKTISSGSIQLKFNKTNFRSLPIAFPNDGLISKYNVIYNSLYQKMETLWQENKRLTALRDKLLPLLMNGQVTVK